MVRDPKSTRSLLKNIPSAHTQLQISRSCEHLHSKKCDLKFSVQKIYATLASAKFSHFLFSHLMVTDP